MTLPHQSETMESAKARVAAALAPIWNATAMQEAGADRPQHHRTHVFDFADGLRLVVSRDRLPLTIDEIGSDVIMHVTCSVDVESTLGGTLPQTPDGMAALGRLAGQRMSELLDCECPLEPMFWKDQSIGHWILEA